MKGKNNVRRSSTLIIQLLELQENENRWILDVLRICTRCPSQIEGNVPVAGMLNQSKQGAYQRGRTIRSMHPSNVCAVWIMIFNL
jgi:hypothetical protein